MCDGMESSGGEEEDHHDYYQDNRELLQELEDEAQDLPDSPLVSDADDGDVDVPDPPLVQHADPSLRQSASSRALRLVWEEKKLWASRFYISNKLKTFYI